MVQISNLTVCFRYSSDWNFRSGDFIVGKLFVLYFLTGSVLRVVKSMKVKIAECRSVTIATWCFTERLPNVNTT